MEPKRACCGSNHPQAPPANGGPRQAPGYRSPVREPAETCGSRKCRYGKSQTQGDAHNTQRLLDKIQYLRKSLQDLENAQQQAKRNEKRDAPCQTPELTPSDVHNIRDIVNSCITEMTKLKDFLDDENCWWKIFKKREFTCCEQKLPHLHGFLDGTMVTLKMLEENLQPGRDFTTSTPIRRPASEPRRRSACPQDGARRHVDAAVNTRRSIDFAGVRPGGPPGQLKCPIPCGVQVQGASLASENAHETRDETSYYHRPFRPEDLRRRSREQEQTFYSLPDGSGMSDVYVSKAPPVDPEQHAQQQQRPTITFSSENMARRSLLAQDMSTSMEAMPPTTIDSSANLQDLTERSFSLNTSRSPNRDPSPRVKKQAQQK